MISIFRIINTWIQLIAITQLMWVWFAIVVNCSTIVYQHIFLNLDSHTLINFYYSYTFLSLIAAASIVYCLMSITIPTPTFLRRHRGEIIVSKNTTEMKILSQLSQQLGIRTPTLLLQNTTQFVALSCSTVFGRPTITLSTGLLKTTDLVQLSFILAHELAHIKHRDSLTNSYVYRTIGLCHQIWRLHLLIHNISITLLGYLPLPKLINNLLAQTLFSLIYPIFLVSHLVAKGITVCDRFLLRRIEYRCDALAAKLTSTQAGISLFKTFKQRKAFSFQDSIYSTHPHASDRIGALEKLNAS